jgi:uncharacterized repeat protein (TIGR02543 family)
MNSSKSLAWLALVWAGLSCGGTANANTVSASAAPLPNHTLTVNAIGSTTITTAQSYPQGSVVNLSPVPTPGYQFTAWSGACTGSTPACSVTMSAARNVTATFAPVAAPTVTLSASPTSVAP